MNEDKTYNANGHRQQMRAEFETELHLAQIGQDLERKISTMNFKVDGDSYIIEYDYIQNKEWETYHLKVISIELMEIYMVSEVYKGINNNRLKFYTKILSEEPSFIFDLLLLDAWIKTELYKTHQFAFCKRILEVIMTYPLVKCLSFGNYLLEFTKWIKQRGVSQEECVEIYKLLIDYSFRIIPACERSQCHDKLTLTRRLMTHSIIPARKKFIKRLNLELMNHLNRFVRTMENAMITGVVLLTHPGNENGEGNRKRRLSSESDSERPTKRQRTLFN